MTSLLLSPEPPRAVDLATGRDYSLADATKRWPRPCPTRPHVRG